MLPFLLVLGLSGTMLIRQVLYQLTDSRYAPKRHLDLTEPTGNGNGSSKPDGLPQTPRFVLAVAPVLSPEKCFLRYDGLVRYLARKLGRSPSLVQRPTYAELNELVRQRSCDVAIVCPYAFVRGERTFGMEALAIPIVKGADTYCSFLVAPAGSRARSLLDFRGARFATADLLSWSGWAYPVAWLSERGEDPYRFFGEHRVVGSHNRAVRAVAEGFVDAAAVDSLVFDLMVEEEPALLENVTVIERSAPFGNPPVVVHPQIDGDVRARLLAALLGMHEDPEGRAALVPLKIDRFVPTDGRIYDPLRQAAAKACGTHR